MHENRFNEYRIPSGMLIVFLEKALTLIHMETHLDDVSFFCFAIACGRRLATKLKIVKLVSSQLTLGWKLRP